MTINSKTKMTRGANGEFTAHQPAVNGWEISYNPDTESVCMHGADGSIVRSWSLRNKLGKLTYRGWDNLLYNARKMAPPNYRED